MFKSMVSFLHPLVCAFEGYRHTLSYFEIKTAKPIFQTLSIQNKIYKIYENVIKSNDMTMVSSFNKITCKLI